MGLANVPAAGQLQFESEPINYDTAPVRDAVALLQQRLERGEANLSFDEQHGYLRAVLQQLNVPVSSQTLVFSQTSFQLRRISPQRPRAVYFNDNTYVGWVQGGEVIEAASVDPHQGAIFYTISQEPADTPQFVRDRGQCLTCHASSRTSGVPGLLVRSVFPDRAGRPILGSGAFTTDHRSPFAERWGGWYVTGKHGAQRHMGNVYVRNSARPEQLDVEAGANVADLSDRLNVAPYLSPHSDIVALMVLEHQSQMHNRITRANFETRVAVSYDRVMNETLKRPEDFRSESTLRRIAAASDQLVDYLLFVDEFQLTDPVAGLSPFAAEFAAAGPHDRQGRSLRDLDLQRRLLKHPCSYLIYSDAFRSLPQEVKDLVYRRLWDVLRGVDDSDRYAHLAADDRQAILEILRDTMTDLPDYWGAGE